MIHFQDYTSDIRESKSRRKELRFKPSIIDAIERASQAVGMDSGTFIMSAAYRAAQEVESAQHKTILPTHAFDAFAEAVNRPAKDNPALSALLDKSRALISEERSR